MTQDEFLQATGRLYETIHQTHAQFADLWYREAFLRTEWWISAGLTVVPWLIWWWLHKRESTHRLLYVAFFVMLVTSCMDFLGVALGLWHYGTDIVPTMPAFVPFDLCLFPVLITLFIQFRPEASALLKSVVFAAFCAFVAEPLFVSVRFYVLVNWNYVYSFVVYGVIYLLAHWVSRRKTFAPL